MAKQSKRVLSRRAAASETPTDLREWIKNFLLTDSEYFVKCLRGLSPQEYVQAYLRLINYIVPKQRPVDGDKPQHRSRWSEFEEFDLRHREM